jgi:C1A family cysteine protease
MVIPSKFDHRDYLFELMDETLPKRVPRKIDLRDKLNKIRDQKDTSTCVAQTLAAMKEYQEKVELNRKLRFSPRFIYSYRMFRSKDMGMSIREGLHTMLKRGVALEKDFPWKLPMEAHPTEEVEAKALPYRIKSYAQVKTKEGLKKALAFIGPVASAMKIRSYGSQFWRGELDKGLHAILIVGYDDRKRAFLVRNSWGEYWGMDGYTWLPYREFEELTELWVTIDETTVV